MENWVRDTNLTEVFQGGKPRPTWKPSEGPQTATLDRAFVSHPDLLPITMSVKWHKSPIVFDHAMLLLCLSRLDAGIGYAGASRPDEAANTAPRGYFNMPKWLRLKDEWQQLFKTQLQALDLEHQHDSPDPYEALKQAEMLGLSCAQALAPKHIRKPSDVRRAFSFAGNRTLFRELNFLRKARALVHKVLTRDSILTRCPHRLTRWSLEVATLHHRVHRSRYPVPPPLDNAPYLYFLPEAQTHLRSWMDQNQLAITVRQHAVRESYEKARHNNLQALRKKRKAAHGVLDKYTIQEALGKCQPRQRMWGVSGQVIQGLHMIISMEQHVHTL
jgi:hypothetical protein